jgi:hypothetical protein
VVTYRMPAPSDWTKEKGRGLWAAALRASANLSSRRNSARGLPAVQGPAGVAL